MNRRLPVAVRVAGAILGIALLIWLPRGLDLDRLVTPDEPLWLARSANFAKGLTDGNFDQTYQYAHPGVTTMWAGAIGYWFHAPNYVSDGPDRVRQSSNEIAGVLTDLGYSPLATLAAGRLVLTIFVTLALAGTAWYAVRLFGLGPGLLGSAILATDPYHVALSRLLHIDAMMASFVGLAAVAWLAYLLAGRRRGDLIVAGIAIGLAGLTRSLAVVLLPMIVLSAAIEVGPDADSNGRRITGALRSLLIAGGIALATVVVCWPALWTSPIGTIKKLVTVGFSLAETAHARPVFFEGAIYNGTDPGFLFYPVSFLWRTTPALLVGLLCALVAVGANLRSARRGTPTDRRDRAPAYLLMLALTELLMLDLSAKKLDRYVIAIVPPLALVAGWGYGAATRRLAAIELRRHRTARAPRVAAAVAMVLVSFNLYAVARLHPYGLDYYNPVMGGPAHAASTMMIGWGEGLDQIAEVVAAQPDAADARVITPVWRTPLDYFVTTPAVEPFSFSEDGALTEYLGADYFIWYITPDQRGYIPPAMQAYFAGLTPIKTVTLAGIPYAALYDLRTAPIPSYFANQLWMAPVATGANLLTASLNAEPVPPGDEVTALCYLSGNVPEDASVTIQLSLTGPDGRVIQGNPQSVRGDDAETVWTLRRRIVLPADAIAGTYWVSARFSDGTTSNDVVLGFVTVQTEPVTPTPTPLPSDAPTDEG